MGMSPSKDLTELLVAWSRDEKDAGDRLLPLVYDQLRRIAARHLGKERPDHTLEPTALVHEAYLRLVAQKSVEWQNRRHFFAIAARLMRRVLLDHARRRRRSKRGPGAAALSLEAAVNMSGERAAELVALDDALNSLAAVDPSKAAIVELRFFGGLSVPEVAHVVNCSPTTVARHWRLAKAWLSRELEGDEPHTR